MYLNKIQIAERLGISTDRVKKLIEEGKLTSLPTSETGRKYYKVDEKQVSAYKRELRATNHTVKTTTKVISTTGLIPEGFVDLDGMMTQLGMGKSAVYKRLKIGEIESFKIGHRAYYRFKNTPIKSTPAPAVSAAPAIIRIHGLQERFTSLETRLDKLEKQLAEIVTALGGL